MLGLLKTHPKNVELENDDNLDVMANNCALMNQIICLLLGSPYRLEYKYWESILLMWRLYSVLIPTFIANTSSALLCLFIGNFIIMCAQFYCQPFKNSKPRYWQMLALLVYC
jgi:hypothetical protein